MTGTRGDYWISVDGEGTVIEGTPMDACAERVFTGRTHDLLACAVLLAACVLEPMHPRRAEALQRARELGLIDD
jgi:hypothetical protein